MYNIFWIKHVRMKPRNWFPFIKTCNIVSSFQEDHFTSRIPKTNNSFSLLTAHGQILDWSPSLFLPPLEIFPQFFLDNIRWEVADLDWIGVRTSIFYIYILCKKLPCRHKKKIITKDFFLICVLLKKPHHQKKVLHVHVLQYHF